MKKVLIVILLLMPFVAFGKYSPTINLDQSPGGPDYSYAGTLQNPNVTESWQEGSTPDGSTRFIYPSSWVIETEGKEVLIIRDSQGVAGVIFIAVPPKQGENSLTLAKLLANYLTSRYKQVSSYQKPLSNNGEVRLLVGEALTSQGVPYWCIYICKMNSSRGGFVLGTELPKGYKQAVPIVTKILTSFTRVNTASALNINLVKWVEPTQGAFTMPVPAGWQIRGGVENPYFIGIFVSVVMQSPASLGYIELHAPQYPYFGTPGNYTTLLGIREGQLVPHQNMGGNIYILRYLTAPQYIQNWLLPQYVTKSLSNIRLSYIQENQEVGKLFNVAPGVHFSAAIAEGQALCQGRECGFFLLAETDMMGIENFAPYGSEADLFLWQGSWAIVLGLPQDMAFLKHLFIKILAGVEINPNWYAAHMRGEAQRANLRAKTADEINAIEASMLANRMNTEDNIGNELKYTVAGQQIIEASSGDRYVVETGADKYYFDTVNNLIYGLPSGQDESVMIQNGFIPIK